MRFFWHSVSGYVLLVGGLCVMWLHPTQAYGEANGIVIEQKPKEAINVTIDPHLIPDAKVQRTAQQTIIRLPKKRKFKNSKLRIDKTLAKNNQVTIQKAEDETTITVHSNNVSLSIQNLPNSTPPVSEALAPVPIAETLPPAPVSNTPKHVLRLSEVPHPGRIQAQKESGKKQFKTNIEEVGKTPSASLAWIQSKYGENQSEQPSREKIPQNTISITPPSISRKTTQSHSIQTASNISAPLSARSPISRVSPSLFQPRATHYKATPVAAVNTHTATAKNPDVSSMLGLLEEERQIEERDVIFPGELESGGGKANEEAIPLNQVLKDDQAPPLQEDGLVPRIMLSLTFVLGILVVFMKWGLPKLVQHYPKFFNHLASLKSASPNVPEVLSSTYQSLKKPVTESIFSGLKTETTQPKRTKGLSFSQKPDDPSFIQVTSSVILSPQKTLHFLTVNNHELLVADTPEGLSLIKDFTPSESQNGTNVSQLLNDFRVQRDIRDKKHLERFQEDNLSRGISEPQPPKLKNEKLISLKGIRDKDLETEQVILLDDYDDVYQA